VREDIMAKEKETASEKGAEIGKAIGSAIGKEIDKERESGGCCEKKWQKRPAGGGGAVYGLGLIGSLIYFIQHATGFWMGALGILKAIIWPVLLVYKLLGMVGL
jgi:hypothetical protein